MANAADPAPPTVSSTDQKGGVTAYTVKQITIQSNNGTFVFEMPLPHQAKNNYDLVQSIAKLAKVGMKIQEHYLESKNVEDIRDQYSQWFKSVDDYLSSQLDQSYSVQFELAQDSSASYPNGYPVAGSNYLKQINAKNGVLDRLISELRR